MIANPRGTIASAARILIRTFFERLYGESAAHWLNADRLQFYSIGALISYAAAAAIYLFQAVWMPHEYISPLAIDFLPFWSASHLALQGHAVDAYNFAVLGKIESAAVGHPTGILLWLYPPSFLLFVYPFALLPWKIAATIFLGCTYVVFVKSIHVIVGRKEALLVAMAFPGTALVVVAGQNGLLTASLVAFGLALLGRRPVLAGICFGVLCVKPQLAVLVPLALLCSRSWRALAALAVTALSMLAVSVAIFGADTLAAFVHNMGTVAGYVETGRAALYRIPSGYSLVKLMHLPTTLANAVQAVSALSAAAAVCYAWSRPASHPLRAATLVCASLMVSPYLYDYDLAWLGVFIASYTKHGMERGWRPWHREWLIVLWLMPWFGVLVVSHIHVQVMPLMLALTLGMTLQRIAAERRKPADLSPTEWNGSIGAREAGANN